MFKICHNFLQQFPDNYFKNDILVELPRINILKKFLTIGSKFLEEKSKICKKESLFL